MNPNFVIPNGLTDFALQAAEIIIDTTHKKLGKEPYAASRVFYTPEEWKRKNELYGLTSQLIVVYDGSELAPFFDLADDKEDLLAGMEQALRSVGAYSEPCTAWYSAIYRHRSGNI
jgi:hypothetical protein